MRMLLASTLLLFSCSALAENIIRTPAPVTLATAQGSWILGDPVSGPWINNGQAICSGWIPLSNEVQAGSTFAQSRTCDQPQQQSVTVSEINDVTQQSRVVSETTHNRTIQVQESQQAQGTGNFTENYFVVRSASCFGSAMGYSYYHCPQNRVPEMNDSPSSYLKYLWLEHSNGGRFVIVASGDYPAREGLVSQVRIDWMDSSNNVLHTATYLPPFSDYNGEGISGVISTSDYNRAWASNKIKITYRAMN